MASERETREPGATPLADKAAERVRAIVEAAEMQAAEIEAEARKEADRIVTAAREEAKEQIDRAQGAVSRLVEQADELRSAVGKLGSDIASQVKQAPAASSKPDPPKAETPAPPEIDPQPPTIPESTPPLEPEPTPPQTPEPTPPVEPEPMPPQTPEPTPPGPQISSGARSTDDLLAQLKGDVPDPAGGSTAAAGNRTTAEAAGNGDAAARLVAMKMALDGVARDEIATHLEDNFSLSSADELLDDVLARARP